MATFAVAGWKTIQSIGQYKSGQSLDVKNKAMEDGFIFAAKAARAALAYFTLYAANVWVGHLGIKVALVATSWCISSPATLEVAALATCKWAFTYWNSGSEVYKQFEQTIGKAVQEAGAQGIKDCYSIIPTATSTALVLSTSFNDFLIARGDHETIRSLFNQSTIEVLKCFGCAITSLFSATIYFIDPINAIRFRDPLGLDAKITALAKNHVQRPITQ